MSLVNILIAAVVAIIFYVIATWLVVFPHSVLVFGLIALVIFLVIASGRAAIHL